MSPLVVKTEPAKENLCKIDEFEVGEVCIDTENEEALLIISPDNVLSGLVDDYLSKVDPEGDLPPFESLDNVVVAASLDHGSLLYFAPPYRKVMKRVKSARLYVKE